MGNVTASTGVEPYVSQEQSNGVTFKTFTGASTTLCAIAAAAGADTRHVIVDGYANCNSTLSLAIQTGTEALDTLHFNTYNTRAALPRGLEMGANQALNLKPSTGAQLDGWIKYVTLTDGAFCSLVR